MKKLDFLSNSPKTFIFQKSSNKTTFGGFLTIIYILVILIIAFTYIYNYVVNDKYIISYINYEKPITNKDITELQLDKNPDYNPTLNFLFDLLDTKGNPLSENFLLLDWNTRNLIERGEFYQYNVSNLNIFVIYNCSDINCSLQPEDKKMYETGFNDFLFYRVYQKFTLDFQNKEKPLDLNFLSFKSFIMNPDVVQKVIDDWQIIQMKEEKGMLENFFGSKKDFFGGDFARSYSFYTRNQFINTTDFPDFNFSGYYKIIFTYNTRNSFRLYDEYSRKKFLYLV